MRSMLCLLPLLLPVDSAHALHRRLWPPQAAALGPPTALVACARRCLRASSTLPVPFSLGRRRRFDARHAVEEANDRFYQAFRVGLRGGTVLPLG